MKILFWNTNKTNLVEELKLLSSEIDPDVIIFAENNMAIGAILTSLNFDKVKYFFNPDPICRKILIFSKFRDKFIRPITSNRRYSVREISVPSFPIFNLMGLHYQSKLHWGVADQSAHSNEMRAVIEGFEMKTGNRNTIVIGDFNMNPFDFGMVQSTGLHAVMSKDIALKEKRVVDGKEYSYFYNPMWSFYGDHGKGKVNGTFYKTMAKPINYFWNILDQVLVRPSFLNHFDEDKLTILTEFGQSLSLLNKSNTINKSISDHLPLLMEIKR